MNKQQELLEIPTCMIPRETLPPGQIGTADLPATLTHDVAHANRSWSAQPRRSKPIPLLQSGERIAADAMVANLFRTRNLCPNSLTPSETRLVLRWRSEGVLDGELDLVRAMLAAHGLADDQASRAKGEKA